MSNNSSMTILERTLIRAISVKRPHDTSSTEYFTEWLRDNLPSGVKDYAWRDDVGNLHVDCREADHNRTLFVAHVDTVHKDQGRNKYVIQDNWIRGVDAPLGADDGAGCAVLMNLIHGGVPAYYIFTQGEECGGVGSTWIADKMPYLLQEFDRAITFDRKNIDSVITHQFYGRCCSDKFAEALCDDLTAADADLWYSPDPSGVYTDTAEFMEIIPECTNLSVGYYNEHSAREELDLLHFYRIADAALEVQWDTLPTHRDPLNDSNYTDFGYNKYGKDNLKAGDPSYWGNPEQLDGGPDEGDYLADLKDALFDAKIGHYEDLLDMMAEEAYPEDPAMAKRFIVRRRITDDMIADALESCSQWDASTILLDMYDKVHE